MIVKCYNAGCCRIVTGAIAESKVAPIGRIILPLIDLVLLNIAFSKILFVVTYITQSDNMNMQVACCFDVFL